MSMLGECESCGRENRLVRAADGRNVCEGGCKAKSIFRWLGPVGVIGTVVAALVWMAVVAIQSVDRRKSYYSHVGRDVVVAGVRGTIVAFDGHRTFTVMFGGPPTTQVNVDILAILPNAADVEKP
jgi:hypothetical protein